MAIQRVHLNSRCQLNPTVQTRFSQCSLKIRAWAGPCCWCCQDEAGSQWLHFYYITHAHNSWEEKKIKAFEAYVLTQRNNILLLSNRGMAFLIPVCLFTTGFCQLHFLLYYQMTMIFTIIFQEYSSCFI